MSRYDITTGAMCTMASMRMEELREPIYKSFAPNLHDGSWFIAQGRKYADEANAMVAFWGRWVLVGIAMAAIAQEFL